MMNPLNNQHITSVMQAYVDAITGDDVEKILELFTDDAVVEDPIGTPPNIGKEALRTFYQVAIDSCALMELEGNVRARGKWGACAMRAHPKGSDLVIETLDVMEFNEEGLITKMTAYWDEKALNAG